MKKLYRVTAIQEVQFPGTKPMVELYLNPIDLTPEHQAQPSPVEQLRIQLDKSGAPDEAKKFIISEVSTLVPLTQAQAQAASHFIVTQEEYEKIGRPTIGQHLNLDIEIYDDKNL